MKLYKEPSNVSNWFWFRKSNTRENLYCYFTKASQTQKRDVFRTQFVSISQATNLLLVHHLCGTESMSGTNIERNIIETYAKVIWKICIEPNNHYITIHRFLILTKKKNNTCKLKNSMHHWINESLNITWMYVSQIHGYLNSIWIDKG